MNGVDAGWLAAAAGGELVAGDLAVPGPCHVTIDSRTVSGGGELFIGLAGERVDGGAFARQAIDAGADGVIVEHSRAAELTGLGRDLPYVIGVDDPLAALAALARAWRRELGCRVVGVTGSTGKTSTKDILAALLTTRLRVHATEQNRNTEIGLPLTILDAERGTEALVLEMAMRGAGQIAELVAIAEPDVGVVVNVGPVHLELLGTVEAIAAAKAELIRDLRPGAACVVPAGEPLLEPHLRDDLETHTFGEGGDVSLVSFEEGRAAVDVRGDRVELELSYGEPHNLLNTLAGVAACAALGIRPEGRIEPRFSDLRGAVVELEGGVTVVNDCYNANPMSMRAALEHLAASPATRHVAILGGMAELGPEAGRFHRELGDLAGALGIDVLLTVGELALPIAERFDGESYSVATPEEAGALLEELAQPGDRVLIKGSRSVGLERVLG